MRKLLIRWTTRIAVFAGLSLASTGLVFGQAITTGERSAEIAPFVETSLVSPDWGPSKNLGVTAGVDVTRFIRGFVQPGMEFRLTHATGTTVGETSFTGGFKLQTTYHRVIHPYITVLGGYGMIKFTPVEGTYSADNSFVLSLGGGADINILEDWKIRLDYAHQSWNLEPYTLNPQTISAGVSYTIPFHGRGDVR